jgi:hypothetical protein
LTGASKNRQQVDGCFDKAHNDIRYCKGAGGFGVASVGLIAIRYVHVFFFLITSELWNCDRRDVIAVSLVRDRIALAQVD